MCEINEHLKPYLDYNAVQCEQCNTIFRYCRDHLHKPTHYEYLCQLYFNLNANCPKCGSEVYARKTDDWSPEVSDW